MLLDRLFRRTRTSQRPQPRRPLLEPLEDRLCPANLFFNPPMDSGAWNVAANWRVDSINGAVATAPRGPATASSSLWR